MHGKMVKMTKHIWHILIVYLSVQINLSAYGDTFSCNFGTQPACLDYGDKVCSSYSKCVSSDAVCFDAYTCNYQGYICKSVFQDLADDYDELVNKYNRLLEDHQNNIDKYNSLVSKSNDQMACLSAASTIDDVRNCLLL